MIWRAGSNRPEPKSACHKTDKELRDAGTWYGRNGTKSQVKVQDLLQPLSQKNREGRGSVDMIRTHVLRAP